MKTKGDLVADKLTELTNENFLLWEKTKSRKYDLISGYECSVPGGYARLNQDMNELSITPEGEEIGTVYSGPGVNTLARSVREQLNYPWAVQDIMDRILEGEIENGSERTNGNG